nr:FUSC family protein [Lysinibacillus timonensis]
MQERMKQSSIFIEAIKVNKKPFPVVKAFLAGLCAGIPILLFGLLFQNFQYGLIAGLGGFAYLYVFPIPYAQLAKKLTWVVLGLTSSVFLGTLLAPHPIITAIIMGVIGATAIFLFGVFRLIGPSAIFFVLVFAMTTGMPIAPEEAFIRAGLTFLGGLISFLVAMSGWFFNPYGPEKSVVKRSYITLANYLDSIGSEKENEYQHIVMSTLKEAGQTLRSGYIPWSNNSNYNYLYVLNDYANKIFLFVVEHFKDSHEKIPNNFGDCLRIIANLIESKNREDDASILLPHPEKMDEKSALLYLEINEAKDSLTVSSTSLNKLIWVSAVSPATVIFGSFDKNSIVFINALRFGFFTFLAAIIAYEFELIRSFWVPLSCVAVMSGATAVATFHRAIQRSLGTIFGILIAGVILTLHPTGYMLAFFVFLLTFITELFIVKNYGLAALFFTPNALIMAESGNSGQFSFSFFASARLIDVTIGIMIGLIGVWVVGRKSASSRLSHHFAKTIRSQAQVIYVLFSKKEIHHNYGKNIEFNKMETNLTNLRMLYDTASGEIPKDKSALEYFWPMIYTIEELGFLLDKCARLNKRPVLEDEDLAQLLLVFETMANAVEHKTCTSIKPIPDIPGHRRIQEIIEELQKSSAMPLIVNQNS